MWSWFRRWRDDRARVREAERRAVAAFHETDSGRHWGTWIVRKSPGETIVRVMFGDTKPPRRRWFMVPVTPGAPVRELSYDDVVSMGETTAWR